ncbi:hypothetical protein [Gemmatimonas aurantiaca]|uniref:hypothetical protein n=1 Tax=Gemmatimonas aurantiaca TaxID=173480 RepID=UPI00301D1A7E
MSRAHILMSARCHLERVALYTRDAATLPPVSGPPLNPMMHQATHQAAELCEYCASPHLEWRKCKQVCGACGQINRSCADL